MSRSKNKIAVTTLLSALACSATASAAGPNGKDIRSVESQTSFSTRKSSESSIKSARSLEGARSWFQKIPTWAKITALVSAPIVAAEIYNEIAGAVSGKKWYSGKYSFVNLARSKGKDETKKPDENNDQDANQDANLKLDPNSNLNSNPDLTLDININDNKDKKYTNSDGANLTTNGKKDTGLGAAPYIGENVVKKLKEGVEKAKKNTNAFLYKYNNVDVDSEVSTITMLLNSVAKSEVVNGNGYENLKSLFENNDKNFIRLSVDIYNEPKKELCYTLKFETNEVWTGYTMRKVNDKVGMVQKLKWNDNDKKWEVDGKPSNFNLIK